MARAKPQAAAAGTPTEDRAGIPRSFEKPTVETRSAEQSTEAIAALAYHLWQERGCPVGDPEVDWFAAEILVRNAHK